MIVQIVGPKLTGASDTARDVRTRFNLPDRTFALLLIGKDGHVALRSDAPIEGNSLEKIIDAMPMRKTGQR